MINGKKIAGIVQARMTSTRLPGKALIDICGRPALQRVIERLRASKILDDVVVACTTNEEDDTIVSLCEKLGCSYFRGSEEDVLSRVLGAAKKFEVDVIVEVTADCPLIDWNHVNTLVEMHMESVRSPISSPAGITSNIIERTFPRGYDTRVFNTEVLERINREVDNPIDRQHVSTWAYLNPKGKENYLCLNWVAPTGQDRPDIEVTLDTPEDLELIRWIFGFESQGYNLELTCQDVINLIDTYPSMYEKVAKIQRKDYFQEIQEAYDNMPKGGFVESDKAILHKDTVIPRATADKIKSAYIPDGLITTPKMHQSLLKAAKSAVIKEGAKKEDDPKKRGRKSKV